MNNKNKMAARILAFALAAILLAGSVFVVISYVIA